MIVPTKSRAAFFLFVIVLHSMIGCNAQEQRERTEERGYLRSSSIVHPETQEQVMKESIIPDSLKPRVDDTIDQINDINNDKNEDEVEKGVIKTNNGYIDDEYEFETMKDNFNTIDPEGFVDDEYDYVYKHGDDHVIDDGFIDDEFDFDDEDDLILKYNKGFDYLREQLELATYRSSS